MIKNHRTYLGLYFAGIALLCPCLSQAQNSSSQEVNAGAAIFAPLRLLKLTDLNFGGIVQGPNGGNIIMSERGSRIFPDDPLGPSAYNGSNALAKTGAMA